MQCIITVDTEADNQWKSNVLTLENIKFLPRFQSLCLKYGYTPTYFITYEVADSPEAAAMLGEWQKRGEAEVGAHLHPWSTPPLSERDVLHRFPSELSDEELRQKLEILTERITVAVSKPTSYRAGRWGFDIRHVPLLVSLGYTTDASITPHVNWQNSGGPDWSDAPEQSHYIEADKSKILEVPMTILYPNLLRRLLNKPRWFRIFKETTPQNLEAVVRAAQRQDIPYLMFMVHSSELMPGGSPYFPDEQSVERWYQTFESLLKTLQERGINGSTLSHYYVR